MHHADLAANRCLTLYLTWPTESDPRYAGIELPELWALLDVALTGDMRDCTEPRTPSAEGRYPVTGAAGTLSWEPSLMRASRCCL